MHADTWTSTRLHVCDLMHARIRKYTWIWMSAYRYVHACMHMPMQTCICIPQTHIRTCTWVLIDISILACKAIRMRCVCEHACITSLTCVRLCMCPCAYKYLLHIYIYIYIYVGMQVSKGRMHHVTYAYVRACVWRMHAVCISSTYTCKYAHD